MAGSMDMKQVRVGQYTFKVRPSDLELFLAVNPDAVVIDDEGPDAEPSVDSHSDQEIGQVEALVEAIPALTEKQARAIVAAGYTLATLPPDESELTEIKGIGGATAEKIAEALSE